MYTIDFIKMVTANMEDEIRELIFSLETVSHSPQELAFVSGRIAELSSQRNRMEQYEHKAEYDEL